ncbi:MAG: hypothetical protein RRY95_01185 [Oscillospiraceae bacterium]
MRRKSRQLAFCGVLAALSIVLMLLGSIVPFATFCCPILAMLALLPILEEWGARRAALCYAAISLLSLLLVPDKEVALFYLFYGGYPVLRPTLDRIRPGPLRVLTKLLTFNAATLALYWVVLHLFQLTAVLAEFAALSRAMLAAMLLMGNVTFLLLDIVLRRMTWLYRAKLRKKLFPSQD